VESFNLANAYDTESSSDGALNSDQNNPGPTDLIQQDFAQYEAQYSYKNHFFMPNQINCIDLLRRLRATKASLNTYESMMEWHFKAIGDQNSNTPMGQHPNYISKKKIYKLLFERYNLTGKVSIPIKVTLSSSRAQVLIVKNKVEWCIQSLLTDPRITDDDYLFFNNNPYCPPPQYTNTAVADINTGEAYRNTWAKYINKLGQQALLPVIFYLDAASTGQFVDLPITALKMTLGIFNLKTREKTYAWRTSAYLPKIGEVDKKWPKEKECFLNLGTLICAWRTMIWQKVKEMQLLQPP